MPDLFLFADLERNPPAALLGGARPRDVTRAHKEADLGSWTEIGSSVCSDACYSRGVSTRRISTKSLSARRRLVARATESFISSPSRTRSSRPAA